MPADTVLHQEEHAGYIIKIVFDDDPMDPRDWDNLGRMLCFDTRYSLGDTHGFHHLVEDRYESDVRKEIMEEVGARVALPLYLLDHSGLAMRAGSRDYSPSERSHAFIGDTGGWDTSHVGWIMDSTSTRDMMGMEESSEEHIERVLRSEVEVYSAYLQGLVYGFILEDDGELVDSCFGFYDEDEAMSEARLIAEHEAEEAARPCDLCDTNGGWLIMSYSDSEFDPDTLGPSGPWPIQRCDECQVYDSDLDAALAFAADNEGGVLSIEVGDSSHKDAHGGPVIHGNILVTLMKEREA